MEDEVVLVALHKRNIGKADAAQLAGGDDAERFRPAAAAVGERLLQLDAEQLVLHGLDQKVERVDLVAADGVLSQSGDEDDAHVFVLRAQALCRLQPVHVRHGDI